MYSRKGKQSASSDTVTWFCYKYESQIATTTTAMEMQASAQRPTRSTLYNKVVVTYIYKYMCIKCVTHITYEYIYISCQYTVIYCEWFHFGNRESFVKLSKTELKRWTISMLLFKFYWWCRQHHCDDSYSYL